MNPKRMAVVTIVATAVAMGGAAAVRAVAGRRSAARGEVASADRPLDDRREKASYAMGVEMARNVERLGVEYDPDAVARGLRDALSKKELAVGDDELRASLVALRTELTKRRAEAARTTTEARRAQGEAFLAENAKKDGVVTLPSGLQYRVLEQGSGKTPRDEDAVVCNYRGALADGTEFDSSRAHGGPATFQLRRVIPGWKEALKLMPVGSRWEIVVPPQLGYGKRGAGRKIGPDATLVFDVELLAIRDDGSGSGARARPAKDPGATGSVPRSATSSRTPPAHSRRSPATPYRDRIHDP
jgi:FKBP-type peptidyl-prolyl cis-trans isomerase